MEWYYSYFRIDWSDSSFNFAAYDRMNGKASLQCNTEDILSKSNGNLLNPIGLITSDEVVLNGIKYGINNIDSYLYTKGEYWTMTPAYYNNGAYVFMVGYMGECSLHYYAVTHTFPGVRPVINLRSDVQITGTGSQTDPFVVVKAS